MRLWLADQPPVVRDRLMGPVRLILLPSSVHPSEVIRQENPEQPMAQYADKPWLFLTSDQLDHLSEAKRERVARQLIEYCQQHFPLRLQGLDDVEQQQQWAIGCQRCADRHGYGAADEVMRWVNLYAVLGDDFPMRPTMSFTDRSSARKGFCLSSA